MRKERQDVVVVEVVGVSCRVNLLILFTAALLNCSIFTKYILLLLFSCGFPLFFCCIVYFEYRIFFFQLRRFVSEENLIVVLSGKVQKGVVFFVFEDGLVVGACCFFGSGVGAKTFVISFSIDPCYIYTLPFIAPPTYPTIPARIIRSLSIVRWCVSRWHLFRKVQF